MKNGKVGSQNCNVKVCVIDRAKDAHPNMSLSSILELLLNKEVQKSPSLEIQRKLTEFIYYMKLNFHPELVDSYQAIFEIISTSEDLDKVDRDKYKDKIREVLDSIYLEINNQLGKSKVQGKKVVLLDYEVVAV
jgi:hypothetical protein